jgi:hypothetical protein
MKSTNMKSINISYVKNKGNKLQPKWEPGYRLNRIKINQHTPRAFYQYF